MTRKSIFTVYNILKNDSKKNPSITMSRLNKALGLAQKKDNDRPYYTTMQSCTCPDATQRSNLVCKHRLALMLLNPQETLEIRFNNRGPWELIYKEKSDE